ncbi:hypothetical protein PIROE2DRAFT_64327 [Piromyces sp. E2]|nr:hypothetical protein PIROE2DRAFT_64327 [Piromyces sp. E2]|eukprot:OUM58551.1 hypothetical protein PIROE2DRAFT_64327 [Piromyces sp. E2]
MGNYSGKYKLGRFPDMCTNCLKQSRFECLLSNYARFKCSDGRELNHRFLYEMYITDENLGKAACDSVITQWKYKDYIGTPAFNNLQQDCNRYLKNVAGRCGICEPIPYVFNDAMILKDTNGSDVYFVVESRTPDDLRKGNNIQYNQCKTR